jgi:hypothetical protein
MPGEIPLRYLFCRHLLGLGQLIGEIGATPTPDPSSR